MPSRTPLSRTASLTSSVMSRTESPPAVLSRRSCWNTFTAFDVSGARPRVRRYRRAMSSDTPRFIDLRRGQLLGVPAKPLLPRSEPAQPSNLLDRPGLALVRHERNATYRPGTVGCVFVLVTGREPARVQVRPSEGLLHRRRGT